MNKYPQMSIDTARIGDKRDPEQPRDEGGVGSRGGQREENRFDNPASRRPARGVCATDDPQALDALEEGLKEQRVNLDPVEGLVFKPRSS